MSGYGLLVSRYGLLVSEYGLLVSKYELLVSEYGLLEIMDYWGVWTTGEYGYSEI